MFKQFNPIETILFLHLKTSFDEIFHFAAYLNALWVRNLSLNDNVKDLL
jgi:hypothetical protein